ncbi:hypothetical protein A946_11600 [Methylacidiphilum kamchatkense Kam1]|uniref:Secreted protein n=1 Tax=Methylacidiphilum kamchatkense Kam1 TaxID=1202785 RepID=A0ABR4ZUB3_9BACT|nr:hypothetical protein A946_11600 [Methylacidiphilum kamchatkense Kam1]
MWISSLIWLIRNCFYSPIFQITLIGQVFIKKLFDSIECPTLRTAVTGKQNTVLHKAAPKASITISHQKKSLLVQILNISQVR